MDKRVIFAVAGSGKTTYIVKKLTLEKRCLIVTYTNNNVDTLRNCILRKFGYFPENIKLFSYFTFLNSFCFKPFLSQKVNSKGINWKQPPKNTLKFARNNCAFYIDSHKLLYHNRIARLLETCEILHDINSRIEKYFDCVYIDEIQDFAGHDFNFLKSIVKANCEILFVGDFYQNTFDTSRDGNVNKGKNFENYDLYKKLFKDMGLIVDTTTLIKSRRCSRTICDFIKTRIGIDMEAYDDRETHIIEITNQIEAENILKDNSIIKLFYDEHHRYNCHSQNWGKSKGKTYNDVCVVLNKTTKQKFDKQDLKSLPMRTKNKFYVACSRARNNLYFLSYNFTDKNE
jgi:superfamily I DNA/RNA helicase